MLRTNNLKKDFTQPFYPGNKIDYGIVAIDYVKHRHGLPQPFFKELEKQGIAVPAKKILDLGTGSGDIAINLAQRGCHVTALDPSPAMIDQAKKLSATLHIDYILGTAEEIKQADASFDTVTAVQAYHWFDSDRALPEMMRVSKDYIVIASYDWKAATGVAWASLEMIRRYNPDYSPYSYDFYFKPLNDLLEKNFLDIRIIDFEHIEKYSHEDWVGRMSTTYGIGPSLPPDKVVEFKQELTETLRKQFPHEPLEIPHRCYAIVARKPTFFAKTNSFAILREPATSFVDAIAQDENHAKPDYEKAVAEHSSYAKTLQKMGIATITCPPSNKFPDGNFVEDPYFVTDQFIIQLNPGAASRKDEYTTLERYLPKDLPHHVIPKQFTIDGGDILKDGNDIYIGLSKRTQMDAINCFAEIAKKYHYRVHPLPVPEGLHLKSGMTCVANKNFVIQKSFEPLLQKMQEKDSSIKYFIVPEKEKHAANVLAFNNQVMMPDNCPETEAYIARFYSESCIHKVNTDEVRKVDGALTCGSLLFKKPFSRKPTAVSDAKEAKKIEVRSRL